MKCMICKSNYYPDVRRLVYRDICSTCYENIYLTNDS